MLKGLASRCTARPGTVDPITGLRATTRDSLLGRACGVGRVLGRVGGVLVAPLVRAGGAAAAERRGGAGGGAAAGRPPGRPPPPT